MLFWKTGKARLALASGKAGELDLRDRRILILADGKRSLDAVVSLLGPDSLAAINRLLGGGYLCHVNPDRGRSPLASRTTVVAGLLRAAADAAVGRIENRQAPQLVPTTSMGPSPIAPPLEAQAVSPPRQSGPRRSLVAAKMYMVDMLQLQRSMEAAEFRVAIQCTNGPEELVGVLLEALAYLVRVSTQSYGTRVLSQLRQVLPEDVLPRLDAIDVDPVIATPGDVMTRAEGSSPARAGIHG